MSELLFGQDKRDEDIRSFIREHNMKRYDVEKEMNDSTPEQREFERRLFNLKIGSNALDYKTIYQYAIGTSKSWKERLGGSDYKVMDIGCGHGYTVSMLEENELKGYGLNVSLIESELATHGKIDEKSKIMLWDEHVKRNIVKGSALSIPSENKYFDGIATHGVLMMLPHTEKIFNRLSDPKDSIDVVQKASDEFYRVLKNDGILQLITLSGNGPRNERSRDYIFFSDNGYRVYDGEGKIVHEGNVGLKNVLEKSGFRDIELKNYDRVTSIWAKK